MHVKETEDEYLNLEPVTVEASEPRTRLITATVTPESTSGGEIGGVDPLDS
jgi:hypothetical protein